MNLRPLVFVVIVAFIIVLIGWTFLSLGSSSKPGVASDKTTAPKILVEVNDILADPIVYNGLNVQVESQVIEWVTKKSFKVGTVASTFGSGEQSILVIRQEPFALPQENSANKLGLGEKVRVHIKGKVAIVNKDQLKQYLGENFDSDEFKLDHNNLNGWTIGPVLLINSVEKI